MATRIFYATDIHSSWKCWKKFINAGSFYKADVCILSGDLTGKAIVPVVETSIGKYKVNLAEQELILKSEEELEGTEKHIKDIGLYPYRTNPDEMEELKADPKRIDEIFEGLMIERVREFIVYADEKLSNSKTKRYICLGNDDSLSIDKIIEKSQYITVVEGMVVRIDDDHEMASSGWTNPTPWDTPRECIEEELYKRIEGVVSEIEDVPKSIFNLHAPPYGSGLDEAPQLSPDLKVSHSGRIKVPVGSTSVRKIIEKYQPLLGLHGHIHECRGTAQIGRTLCVNPGSAYDQGSLLGSVILLEDNSIRSHIPIFG